MEGIDLTGLVDFSWPFIILVVTVTGVRKCWNAVWPWLTETYWPHREKRWDEMNARNRLQDERTFSLMHEHEATVRLFTNGLRQEHKDITGLLERLVNHVQVLQSTFAHPDEEEPQQ